MDLPTQSAESSRDLDMATFCQPKITMEVHETIVEKLVYQRDVAEKECKSVIEELRLITKELDSVTQTMKEQSDAIESYLKTIQTQKTEIDELEAKIAALEKDDPDLSIYEDTMDTEDERQQEFDAINTLVMLILAIAVCMIATITIVDTPLSDTDL